MTRKEKLIVEKTRAFIQKKLSGEGSGHDWLHIERVWKNAQKIALKEKANSYVVELAALLHDIADWKFHGGDLSAGPREARLWLEKWKVPEDVIAHVCQIIETASFKGAKVKAQLYSLEAQVVQDADRLDAIGAIGIARTFAYGGSKGREIYNPKIKPQMHRSFEQYKKSQGPTINHFYEKLLLLKDRMNTPTAKALAKQRHMVMERFLDQFYSEVGFNARRSKTSQPKPKHLRN